MDTSKQLIALALLVATGLFLSAMIIIKIQQPKTPADGTLKVVASYYPLYDFAQQVGGNKVAVTNITPAGSEPHDYEPTPQQLAAAQDADVFIYNGAGIEPWVQAFLPDFKGVIVKASDGIELHPGDPHFWLDPVLAKQIAANIQAGFNKARPNDANYFSQQATAYTAKLDQLNNDIQAGLATCQLHTIITSHDAFGYFAKRYNLNVVPIAGISPQEEPSAAKLAELSRLAKSQGIHYIFFESLVSPSLAQTIAREAGAQTTVFDTIEGLTDEARTQGKNYLTIQRDNLAELRAALACK